jgi:hypothetical protein
MKFAELAHTRAEILDVHFACDDDLHALRDFLATDLGKSVRLYRGDSDGARGEEIDLPRRVDELPPDQSEAV